MYAKLDENEMKYIDRICEITYTDYDIKDSMVSVDNLIIMLEDLYTEYECLKEEYEDFKKDVKDNYEHIPYEEQIGHNEKDFIE